MRQPLRLSLLAAACLSSACKPSTNQTASSPAPAVNTLLGPGDLMPPQQLQPIAAQEVVNDLQGTSFLYNNMPKSAPNCIEALIGQTIIQGSATNISATVSADAANCTNQALNANGATSGVTYTVSTANLKLGMVYNCTRGDLSSLVGKPLSTVMAGNSVVGTLCAQVSVQLETIYAFNAAFSGASSGSVTSRSVGFTGGEGLTYCSLVTSAGVATQGPCVELSISTTTITRAGTATPTTTANYTKLSEQSILLDAAPTAVWPRSGTINIADQNWTGTATYTAATVPPQLTMQAPGLQPFTTTLPPKVPGSALTDSGVGSYFIQAVKKQVESPK